jgi:alanine racemase
VIDLDALGGNFRRLRSLLRAGCEPMPVVKADGYGHGAAEVSRRLQREGARRFAVAVVEEGAELRREGIHGEILVMGWIGGSQLPDLLRHRLTPNAHSLELLAELASFAEARRMRIPLHLKVDTGMTRLGIRPEELGEAIAILARTPLLSLEGLFQNFATADDPEDPQTAGQVAVLAEIHEALRAAGLPPEHVHVANSAGMLRPPAWPERLPRPSWVRPGLVLFTRFPGLPEAGAAAGSSALSDVMSFVSVVDQVKVVPPGTRVGYGGTFTAVRPTRLAMVPAGYADGVPRSASGRAQVLVHGRRCPLAGRVSMDLTAVDVTDLPDPPRRGNEVVFFGLQRGVRLGVEELAEAAGTMSWEILCGVGPRVPREIRESGAPSRVVSRFLPKGEAVLRGAP